MKFKGQIFSSVFVAVVATANFSGFSSLAFAEAARQKFDEQSFSIAVPEGWDAARQENGSVKLQAPKSEGDVYQRNVQVLTFPEGKVIDEITAAEFEALIAKKFSEASAAIEDFRMRNHAEVDMANGTKGYLFYSEFKINDVALMQAHVLASGAEKHYLATFTDLIEHFEKDDSPFLTEAFSVLNSIEAEGKSPVRGEALLKWVFLGLGILIVGCVFIYIRQRNAVRHYLTINESDLAGVSIHSAPLSSNLVKLKSDDNGGEDAPQTGENVFSLPTSRIGSGKKKHAEEEEEAEPQKKSNSKKSA